MAVLGDKGVVVGIIYSDDVLRALQEEKAVSLYHFAGVRREEAITDGVAKKIKFRHRWLIINIAMSFLIAFTVSLFEDVISQFVLLAVYMPIVAGMAGNAGTQTLAVMVRGIALKQVDLSHAKSVIIQEILAAVGNGIIIGTLVGSIVFIVNRNFELAFILGVSMVAIFCFAAFFGALAPLILHRLGKDPATSAMVFITTAADILGFFVFLGLASLILT
jgi:magnesium transporter